MNLCTGSRFKMAVGLLAFSPSETCILTFRRSGITYTVNWNTVSSAALILKTRLYPYFPQYNRNTLERATRTQLDSTRCTIDGAVDSENRFLANGQ